MIEKTPPAEQVQVHSTSGRLDPNGPLNDSQFAHAIFQDFEMWARNFAVFNLISGGEPQRGMTPNILQRRVIAHYRKCQIEKRPCLIMILKPRQKGASTIAEAVIYHHMRRHKGLKGALMGDVQSTSDKVFEMFRLYAQKDEYPYPDGRPNIADDEDLTKEVTLGSGSKMWKETAGSSNAGRSGTVQCLHLDEVAYFPVSDTKDPTTAVLGAFYKESPISLGFATSTARGATGWFHDTWWAENDWEKIFAAWFEFPDAVAPFANDEQREHFERTMTKDELEEAVLFKVSNEQLHWRRKKIRTDYKGDIGKFRQEFPSSARGAFLSSSRLRFDEGSITAMLASAQTNFTYERGNLVRQNQKGAALWFRDDSGDLRRIEEPRFGMRYLISADSCTGADQQIGGTTANPDFHSFQVWRQGYMDQNGTMIPPKVVMLHHSRDEIDMAAETLASMSMYYGKCMVVPEVNNCGLALVKALVRLGVPVFKRQSSVVRRKQESEDERLEAYGWSTDKMTKKWLMDTIAPLIRLMEVDFSFPEILEQFQTFIISNTGEAKAAPSKHDDHVMSAAIALYNLAFATEYKLSSLRGIALARLDPRDGFSRRIQ